MDETVYIMLEGGIVLPISHVTEEFTSADIEIYDGETYRNTIDGGYALLELGTQVSDMDILNDAALSATYSTHVDSTSFIVPGTGDTPTTLSAITGQGVSGSTITTKQLILAGDEVANTAPRFKAKQRTLWSFPRLDLFTHVVWGDEVIGTSSDPPYRLGMTPTVVA